MGRREFLLGSTAGLAALLFKWPSSSAQLTSSRLADSRIDVLSTEPLGTISPNIYGHFTENLGGVIYDGVWVGENSKVPNQYGIRSALIEHLRRIKAPVIRWPGGCFADSYNWRDGVGPREKRLRRMNFWSGSPQSRRSTNMIPINSAPMILCASVVLPVRSPTWRRIYAASPPESSIVGLNTAILPKEALRWPTCARPAAHPSHLTCSTGASETSPGEVEASSPRRSTQWSFAASVPGCPPMARNCI